MDGDGGSLFQKCGVIEVIGNGRRLFRLPRVHGGPRIIETGCALHRSFLAFPPNLHTRSKRSHLVLAHQWKKLKWPDMLPRFGRATRLLRRRDHAGVLVTLHGIDSGVSESGAATAHVKGWLMILAATDGNELK